MRLRLAPPPSCAPLRAVYQSIYRQRNGVRGQHHALTQRGITPPDLQRPSLYPTPPPKIGIHHDFCQPAQHESAPLSSSIIIIVIIIIHRPKLSDDAHSASRDHIAPALMLSCSVEPFLSSPASGVRIKAGWELGGGLGWRAAARLTCPSLRGATSAPGRCSRRVASPRGPPARSPPMRRGGTAARQCR